MPSSDQFWAEQFEKLVQVYLAKPTAKHWENIAHRSIPGTSHRTLWQAWIRVDGAAPTRLAGTAIGEPALTPDKKWPCIPAPFTVRRAIRAARNGEVPVGWWWLEEPRPPKVPR